MLTPSFTIFRSLYRLLYGALALLLADPMQPRAHLDIADRRVETFGEGADLGHQAARQREAQEGGRECAMVCHLRLQQPPSTAGSADLNRVNALARASGGRREVPKG